MYIFKRILQINIMKNKTTILLLFLGFFLINSNLWGQGLTCATADPFCSDDPTYQFPAGVGSGSAGSNIGCLYSTPNPAWYFLQVDQAGRINIHMWTTPSRDLDFICWGPFTASSFDALIASGVCSQLNTSGGSSHGPNYGANPSDLGGYPIGNIIDCSYSAQSTEYVHIPNATSGSWYILLITNYSNSHCQINFESHSTSTGSTNCAIVRPFQGDTVCVGETATLVVENPPSGATFTFQGPNGFYQSSTSSTASIPNAQAVNAGTYTLIITPSGGTPGPATEATVVVNPLPNVTATATNICPGDDATLTASGASTYSWSTGQTGSSITVSPSTTTSYTVTGTSSQGCSNTTTVTVTVYDAPAISHISITDDNCYSSTGEISFSHTGGTPPISISWNTSPVSHDTIISNLPAGSYTLTLTDANSCVFTQTYQVITIAGPVISNSSIINATCNQSNGGVNIVINSTQELTYVWSTTPPQTSQNLSGMPAGQYSVTVSDENNCTSTATYTIGNTSGPNISNFNLTHPTCGDNNGSIAITTTGGTQPITYEWNTTPPQTTATASNLPPGSYTVVATDGTGCTITGTYSLQDLASPEITQITKVDETCSASNGSASVIYSGGSAPVNIIWNTVPPQNTLSVHNLPAGTYTVTLRDANNCTATQTVDIVDFPSPIIAEFTSENEMCDGQNGWIQANYTEGTAPIEFEWNTNPVQNTQTAINLTSGDYSVTITDANGCSTVGFESIINHPTPENEFTNIYMDTCIVGIGKVSAFPSGGSGIYSYTWNTVPSQNSQSATSLYPGVYTVTINDGYCTITDTIEIIGIPGPDAAFVANPSLVTLKNPNVNFKDLTDSEIVGWDWFFGDGFHSNSENPTHNYQNTGEYEVTMIVIDGNGCIDTAQTTVTVNIDFGIWIPNSFTPNEDGKNERFGPRAVGFIERDYSMKIYDRWGRLVFETNDFYTQWDGRDHFSNKQKDVISTYVYEIIILDNLNDRHRYFGKINLLY